MLERLRQGIDTIKDDFDILIIDPPPALGMLSLSVVRAATALVVPIRPATVDFGSTAHFFTLLVDAQPESTTDAAIPPVEVKASLRPANPAIGATLSLKPKAAKNSSSMPPRGRRIIV